MHEEISRGRFLDARSSIRTQLSRGPSRERGEEARPGPPRDATRGDILELVLAAALRAPPFHPGYGTQPGWQGARGNSDPGGGLGSAQRLLDGAPSRRHDDDARGDDGVGNWDGCIPGERQQTCLRRLNLQQLSAPGGLAHWRRSSACAALRYR